MIIYGRNVVKEALNAKIHMNRAYIFDSKNLSQEMKQIENDLRHMHVTVEKVDSKRLEAITHSKDHQGIAARTKDYKYSKTFNVLDKINHPPFIVILDRIQDPHNFGAIVRSAYGAGVDLVVIPERGGCPVTPAVLKTSAGYAFRMPISMEVNLARVVEEFKKREIWVYSAMADGRAYDEVDMKGPIAFILGNEGEGVRKLLKDKSDGTISIPMARRMDSLNVSVSAAVILFHAMEVRKNGNNQTP